MQEVRQRPLFLAQYLFRFEALCMWSGAVVWCCGLVLWSGAVVWCCGLVHVGRYIMAGTSGHEMDAVARSRS
ncbi:hypothetical protein DBV39_00510 [Orrella marina]|uniref:Uncharacterized protein n=1 Tax=Orrella marina TaxID=2163011 RepID=A0A2R4XF70_9BURK|nr:hypothetical protein DBV39_00510 [Orrella marina]